MWAAVVEANEKHIVSLSKYKAAFDLATNDKTKKDYPFDSRDIAWMDFINQLLGYPTEDGPITRRDLQVMVKTWDGPFTKDGKRMAYGFGPAIREWPIEKYNQMYGYFKRREDGKLGLMPIAEQALRWFTHNPKLDVHSLTYDDYEKIYMNSKKEFSAYDFDNTDFSAFAARGGKLMIFAEDDVTAGLAKVEPTKTRIAEAASALAGEPLKLRVYAPGEKPQKTQPNDEVDALLRRAQSMDIEITEF